jgi:putative ABC transport system ATP-binding protein
LGVASREARDPSAPLLEASNLYRFFHAGDDEVLALRGVSISVSPGEMVAVAGPSGSGKSTLLACLAGLDEPDGGHVEVAGRRITRRPEAERAALRARWIGVLLQAGNLIDHLDMAANVRLARGLTDGAAGGEPEELLSSVGLRHKLGAAPSRLSGGEAARAGLAVALANDPAVILADEPTAEVDAASEGAVLELLRGRARLGAAVVVVTHSARVAEASDRVVRLVDGRVVDE